MPCSRDHLSSCSACPRLVAERAASRAEFPDYHSAPVAAWGSRRAPLLIVGLAPGRHGANRTGRPFTGDASGAFLFQSMARHGFASSPDANEARLRNVRITNAVKCLPPGNRPLASEIANCQQFLLPELNWLMYRRMTPPAGRVSPRRPRAVLCLGRIAHEAVIKALGCGPMPFAHGQARELARKIWLVDTYHPSRQNTNTGRLTREMLDGVFAGLDGLLRTGLPPSDGLSIVSADEPARL